MNACLSLWSKFVNILTATIWKILLRRRWETRLVSVRGYLSQLIKKETGKTYSELIQQKKLEKAKELLRYSEKTVGEIAQETGYSDYYYFTKTFKRLTKMTPSEYRKKYGL